MISTLEEGDGASGYKGPSAVKTISTCRSVSPVGTLSKIWHLKARATEAAGTRGHSNVLIAECGKCVM